MAKGRYLHQLDVNNKFLNGDLQEVYMIQPQGFEAENKGLVVCRLHKALYGLKQAPMAWFHKLTSTLHGFGFQTSKCDNSLLIKHTVKSTILVLVYVDDIIVRGSSKSELTRVIDQHSSTFALKDLGPLHYFLGIEVDKAKDQSLLLSQTKYAMDLLEKANTVNAKPCPTPMATRVKVSAKGTKAFENPCLYRSIVGASQYLSITRLSFHSV